MEGGEDDAALQGTTPDPDEGHSNPCEKVDETPASQTANDEQEPGKTEGEGDTEKSSPEDVNEPKEAEFPPIDPAAGSEAVAVDGADAKDIVNQFPIGHLRRQRIADCK